ncbi:Phage capsid and scaffold [plant metagenome]|uniref:Phage capsid and scaffold n=1 Tax=plant metagenome TaxID=1297885 RepID=A0A484Q2W1_9ZZZZ
MANTQSKVHMHMNGRLAVKRGAVKLGADSKVGFEDLENIGVGVRGMDSALTGPAVTTGTMLSHMLQTWLPGTLRVVTQVRNIDEIAGITTVGRWEDELISVRVAEPAAKAELYGDSTNIPLADYRQSIESRGVVRFEQGFQVGKLEEARQSAIGYQAADEKRRAATESLDISRNQVGFYGFNQPDTNVYGLLNDPSLPAYLTTGTPWLTATFDQLVTEFNRLYNQIETQMGGQIQDSAQLVLVLPTGYRSIFSVYSPAASGMTFRQWLNENFPNVRVVTTAEFSGANGGLDVAYLFVENAADQDESDIDSASLIQAVPVRYQVLGSENRIKGYIEDAINATAGIFILRPWAFARMTISA